MDVAHAQIKPRHLLRLDLALSNNPQLLFSNHHHHRQQPGTPCHHHRQPLPPPTTIHIGHSRHQPQWKWGGNATSLVDNNQVHHVTTVANLCHHPSLPLSPPTTIHNGHSGHQPWWKRGGNATSPPSPTSATTHHHPQQTQQTPTTMKTRWQHHITCWQQPGAPPHHCRQPLPPPTTSTVTTHHHPQQTQRMPTMMKTRWQRHVTTSGSANDGACRQRRGNVPRHSDGDDACHRHRLQYAGHIQVACKNVFGHISANFWPFFMIQRPTIRENCAWVRSNTWWDERPVSTSLDWFFWFFKFSTNVATGNWKFSEFVQLQLVVWSFAVGFSSISVFFPVQQTGPVNTIERW